MARFTASVVLPTPPFTFPREIIMLISPRYKMLSFHIIEDILSICKGNQNKVCCGGRGIEDIQIFRKYKIGRMLDVSPQAFPSPLWICGRVQHRSAPCTCAESSVPSRTCTPSVPHGCTHGKERQGRSVERATRAHSTVVHGCAIAHTAEAMPPRRPGHPRLAHKWSKRYASQRSRPRTVSAAADTPAPLDCPRARLGCQAAFLPPIGSATRSNSRYALPHRSAPQGAQ